MKIGFITVGAFEREDYYNENLLGTENQVYGLSKELSIKGHDVHIFRRWNISDIETIENVKVRSFKSTNSNNGMMNALHKLKFSIDISKKIEKENFDILILMDPFTSYFLRKLNIPKIAVIHNEIPRELLPKDNLIIKSSILIKIKNYFLGIMQKKFYDYSDFIVSLNSYINNYFNTNGYSSILIPNGLHLIKYKPNFDSCNYIFYGGRLAKGKGMNNLLKAYSLIEEDLQKDYKLCIGGFGPEKENLEKLAIDLKIDNKIEFLPWVNSNKFKKYLSNSSIFVLPSYYETFSIVTIEAMALGKPVIAYKIPGPEDIIKHNSNGFLIEKGNIIQLKEYMERLLKDKTLRVKIGKNARKTVENKYSLNKVADNYIDLFDGFRGN